MQTEKVGNGTLKVVGAIYDITKGKIDFLTPSDIEPASDNSTVLQQSLPGSPIVAGVPYILKCHVSNTVYYLDFTQYSEQWHLIYTVNTDINTVTSWIFTPWSDGSYTMAGSHSPAWSWGRLPNDCFQWANIPVTGAVTTPNFPSYRWNITQEGGQSAMMLTNIWKGSQYKLDATTGNSFMGTTSGNQSQIWTLMQQVNGVWTDIGGAPTVSGGTVGATGASQVDQ